MYEALGRVPSHRGDRTVGGSTLDTVNSRNRRCTRTSPTSRASAKLAKQQTTVAKVKDELPLSPT